MEWTCIVRGSGLPTGTVVHYRHRCYVSSRVRITDERRTYWMSFTDPERPKGTQFLGVIVVDVTREQAQDALMFHPMVVTEKQAWIGACLTATHTAGVNPGGQVAFNRLDEHPLFDVAGPLYPRLQLLTREQVNMLGEKVDEALDRQEQDGPKEQP